MRRQRLSMTLAIGLAAAVTSGLTAGVISGSTAAMADSAAARIDVLSVPAISGQEVFEIVGVTPGPRHARVTARGAFRATGYFVRRTATLVFPRGRIGVLRHALSTTYSGPDLATCWFTIRQSGTFRVFRATGGYRGIRESGQFSTKISARLKRTGPDRCGSKIVYYRAVTYETGLVR